MNDARIPTSLARAVGKTPATEAEIRALAARALAAGVVVFLRADLARIPWSARAIIEAEAQRLYGQRVNR